MKKEFTISLSDYRKARYFALSQRYRFSFRIMALVVLTTLLYLFVCMWCNYEIKYYYLVFSVAYIVWALFIFANAELEIKRYIKSPACLIGKKNCVSIFPEYIHVTIEEAHVDVSYNIKKASYVFEISALFLFYFSTENVFLLPKDVLSNDEVNAIRNNLSNVLKDRFYTRFMKNKALRS